MTLTRDDWRSPAGQLLVRSFAIHEAGHAVARWYLERTHHLGRNYICPQVHHIAVSLEGESVPTSGGETNLLGGVVSVGPFINPMGAPALRCFLHSSDLSTAERHRTAKFWRRAALADIVHIMAGPIAQAVHDAAADRDDWQTPIKDAPDWLSREAESALDTYDGEDSGTDWWQVDQRLPMLGRRWRLHLDRCFTIADKIVRSHQPQIEALASELVRQGKVDGDEAWRLFDGIGSPN